MRRWEEREGRGSAEKLGTGKEGKYMASIRKTLHQIGAKWGSQRSRHPKEMWGLEKEGAITEGVTCKGKRRVV